jgi:hypothetical protein
MTLENWHSLVGLTAEVIDWLDAHEALYDIWFVVAYCATSCALVQYHTWARQMGSDAIDKLKKLRDCVRRWESSSPPEHMSTRRKTAEIISLLYEATQGPPPQVEVPALNPTGGVKGNPPAAIEYRQDPSRPGRGVFVAHAPTRAKDYESKGVPAGTVINSSDEEDEVARQTDVDTPTSPSVMVNITPLTGGGAFTNVNPAMNELGAASLGTVQLMNALRAPQASNTLEQLAQADTGLLEGIPGSMFDWGKYSFYRRTGVMLTVL